MKVTMDVDDGVDGGVGGLGLIIIANPLDPKPKR